eukprot:TRINITY_DN6958_c0_g1_i1.p3 TRINITY_DN6958_c0_g1~~TRINITY_DN6958_c0_g1_i1.p3  ORF type:complete len:104 (-),score=1.62 TRINITY_DN6958_c0_g1_i1:556-867(-)
MNQILHQKCQKGIQLKSTLDIHLLICTLHTRQDISHKFHLSRMCLLDKQTSRDQVRFEPTIACPTGIMTGFTYTRLSNTEVSWVNSTISTSITLNYGLTDTRD